MAFFVFNKSVSLIRSVAFVVTIWFALGLPVKSESTDVANLVAERAANDLAEKMPARGHFEVYLGAESPETGMMIREFWIDHQTGQFIANLMQSNGDTNRISGTAVLKLPVPVTTRRLLPDEIISEADIAMLELPWQRVHTFAVLSREDLIGKQVRRLIAQGRPVQMQSVIPPIVISRGEKVKIVLRNGPLQLTANGRAISDAYLGQEVKVVNLSSNKTIVAIARGDGIAEALQ